MVGFLCNENIIMKINIYHKLFFSVFGGVDISRQKVISLNKDKSMKESNYVLVFMIYFKVGTWDFLLISIKSTATILEEPLIKAHLDFRSLS